MSDKVSEGILKTFNSYLTEPWKYEDAKVDLGDSQAFLELAEKVYAYRIESLRANDEELGLVGGHRIIKEYGEMSDGFSMRLFEVFSRDDVNNGSTARCFLPGIAFRVVSGEESMDILVCLKCCSFVMLPEGGDQHSGRFGGSGYEHVLKLVKDAFPDVKELKSL